MSRQDIEQTRHRANQSVPLWSSISIETSADDLADVHHDNAVWNMLSPNAMTIIYRIISRDDWQAAKVAGAFAGTAHDLRDGFIHFSTAAQVAETAAKHYAGQQELLLLHVDSASLTAPLKWEPSRGGDLFPHLYGSLPVSAAHRIEPLPLDPETGRHVFPDGLA